MRQTPAPPRRTPAADQRNGSSRSVPSALLRTLGCRLNQAESDEIRAALAERGLRPSATDPDVVVVNTCTVTAEASQSSRKLIRRSIADHPDSKIVVTGCFAMAEPELVASMPGVYLVVPNKDKDHLAARIAQAIAGLGPSVGVPARVRANLKIQTGCDEECTFCIVPQTRGDLASRSPADIRAAASALVEAGAREIVLTGVHLGKYGWDRRGSDRLIDLIKELGAVPGLERIRLSSIEASQIGIPLLETLAAEPKACRHLHIPLQTGDPALWRSMCRPGTLDHFLDVTRQAKRILGDVTLTTDVMVGYPGEDDRAFANTLEVVAEVGFRKLHVFRFSPRVGTPAANDPRRVDTVVMRDRSKQLRLQGDRLRVQWLEAQVGRRETVLIERAGAYPRLSGLTDNYLRVYTAGPAGFVGRTVDVLVTSAGADSVEGEIVGRLPVLSNS